MDKPALLPPFPTGWYALSPSLDLGLGTVRPLQFAGQDIVLFRTRSGAAGAMDAYCPHLGAHLGYGGTVEEETIRCPFHGFRYDVQGHCTYIPYGTRRPPKAQARVLPVCERHGFLFAYYDPACDPPTWEIPDLDSHGWSAPLTRIWKFRGHPQETTENSVDLGHFAEVHHYTSVEMLRDLHTDGPHLNARYAMTRDDGLFGRPVRAEFEIHAHGLGYSLVKLNVPQFKLAARLFVFATPLDGQEISLTVAVSLHQDTDMASQFPLFALVPRAILNRLIARQTFQSVVHDVQQDFTIWQHKRYVQPPILAEGDGPVGKYRLWARQFYRGSDQNLIT